MTYKYRKSKEFCMFRSAGFSFFRAEGLSCCLGFLNRNFFYQKNIQFFFSRKFFSIFDHQNPGFETGSGTGCALNQCGSTTLGKVKNEHNHESETLKISAR
jgi:hypothetical protein